MTTTDQQINDLMSDIRTATGDGTYCLLGQKTTWHLCQGDAWAPISPPLTLDALRDYLAAFDAGVRAGYLAAKRRR
jgi:hypothetical protein